MKDSTNIKCVLRTDKTKLNGEVPIYYSIRVFAVTTRIPSGKSILLKDWNQAEACPKKNSPFNNLLGSYLKKQIADWETFILTQQNLGKQITLTIAKSYFKSDAQVTFFRFWETQLELWQNEKQENTLKSYRSTLKMLKAFNAKLDFGDLSYIMVQNFDKFMAGKNNAIGGRFVKHKCLKSMINQAIMNEYIEKNPYRHFKIKASKAVRNFLSIAEVKMLINHEVPQGDVFQQKTKDLWLFSAFTGLRYSDVMNLKWENITNENTITVEMTKTSRQVKIPLTENAKTILNTYGKHIIKVPKAKVFPQIANQVLNRNIKVLMAAAGIDKLMTYHTARHTFGSNLVEANTNIIHIKDLMGHSRIAETQTYAKSLESDLFSTMDRMQNIYSLNHAV